MNEDTLARVDLFSSLDKKELQLLAHSCQERVYSAGGTLFSEGDAGVGLYVVKSGRVRLSQGTMGEDLALVGAGDVIGEMALLDDYPRSATATALDEGDRAQPAGCIELQIAQSRGATTDLSVARCLLGRSLVLRFFPAQQLLHLFKHRLDIGE